MGNVEFGYGRFLQFYSGLFLFIMYFIIMLAYRYRNITHQVCAIIVIIVESGYMGKLGK